MPEGGRREKKVCERRKRKKKERKKLFSSSEITVAILLDRRRIDRRLLSFPLFPGHFHNQFPLKTMAFSVYFGPKTPKGTCANSQGRGTRSEARTSSPRKRVLFFFSSSNLFAPPERHPPPPREVFFSRRLAHSRPARLFFSWPQWVAYIVSSPQKNL